ncbi:MAG TPA: GGDEF domain-containing protein [Rhodocyclaceae bacterium]|nr:GGDEF domain-containing protein [Rhodocyclaceae bacterium]
MIEALGRHLLQSIQLFSNIGLEGVEHLLERCETMTIARGESLLEPGEENHHLYLILDGELRIYLAGSDLPEHAILKSGDCVGEMSLIDGHRVSALVIAAVDTRLLAMPHEILWALVDCSHGVARNLLAILAGRMRNDNLALVTSQYKSLEFEQAASVDALTGIHNRRWLLDMFPRALERCERDGKPLSLLMTDIDRFKRFNDNFGHLAGDAVLKRVARQLADGLRSQDLIARFGGEEFLILLPNARIDEAMLIAERLRDLVATECKVHTSEGVLGVTLSCGVAELRRGELLDDVLERADVALRRAKANGRDQVEAAED